MISSTPYAYFPSSVPGAFFAGYPIGVWIRRNTEQDQADEFRTGYHQCDKNE